MSIRFAFVALVSFLAVSCGQVGNVDYSGIRSVGLANGMGNTVTRNRIGTTAFNNSHEEVQVPGITPKVNSAVAGVLRGKVGRVVVLDVPAMQKKRGFLAANGTVIDNDAFRAKAIEEAGKKGLDAVWIVTPAYYSIPQGRGPATKGYEHRQDSFLGLTNEFVHFTAWVELVDVRSGETLRRNMSGPFGVRGIAVSEWSERFDQMDAARRKRVVDGITEAAQTTMRVLIE